MKRTIGLLALAGALIVMWGYIGILGWLYVKQRDMMYFPYHDVPQASMAGVSNLRDITVTTRDGVDLHGWYVPAATKTAPVIIFFHGNGSKIQNSIKRMPLFIERGYGVLLVEYRGYSGNPGKPTEEGLYNDGRAFLDWLKSQGVPEGQIILYAASLGTGIAVQMATEYAPFRAIVLETPFTSTVDIASAKYPYIPIPWLMKDKFDSYSKIDQIKSPLIVLHGRKDTVVPYENGVKLFERAPQPKTLMTFDEANHTDLGKFGSVEKILSALAE